MFMILYLMVMHGQAILKARILIPTTSTNVIRIFGSEYILRTKALEPRRDLLLMILKFFINLKPI